MSAVPDRMEGEIGSEEGDDEAIGKPRPKVFPMAGGPLGSTVMKPTGPCLNFSMMAGDFISWCVVWENGSSRA